MFITSINGGTLTTNNVYWYFSPEGSQIQNKKIIVTLVVENFNDHKIEILDPEKRLTSGAFKFEMFSKDRDKFEFTNYFTENTGINTSLDRITLKSYEKRQFKITLKTRINDKADFVKVRYQPTTSPKFLTGALYFSIEKLKGKKLKDTP